MDKTREQALKPSWLNFDKFNSPQQQGVEQPPYAKDILDTDVVIELPDFDFEYKNILATIEERTSVRKFKNKAMTLDVLSYLLHTTARVRDDNPRLRMVPSAGARHAIDTYIYAHNIEGLERGLYRYHPMKHVLVLVHDEDIETLKLRGFRFNAPCVFMWTAIPYRMVWRYAHCAEKLILLDAGHICQNLYLAAESIDYGVCAVGAYDQDVLDQFMKIDGEEECLIYAAPVGLK